jgi:soluble lytic murein transglycosylase-like protein
MNYLKRVNVILFLLSFIAVLEIGLVFSTERLIQTVEEFEPVIIEEVIEEVIEPVTVYETKYIVADLISRPMLEPRIDCILDDETQQMILEKSEQYNVDFAFTMALIFRESSFDSDVVSKSNDYGLMQINKINHEWLSEELGITNFLDPEQNVTAGLYILHNLFEKYDDPTLVLMAYNMGETGARRLWVQGIYSTDYAEDILQQADIYDAEIAERMGE